MALTVVPAQPLDFLEALDVKGRPYVRNRRTVALCARQVSGSWAFTARDEAGRLVAIAGVWGGFNDDLEAWFTVGEAIGPNLLTVVRLIRSALAHLATEAWAHADVVAYIDPDSVAGERLAASLGFQPCGPAKTPAGTLLSYRRHFP